MRLRPLNTRPWNPAGDFVVYWMIASRRLRWNFALQHAVDQAAALRRPLVILEALDCDYPWASDRLHQFVIEGMAANAREATRSAATYYPYIEPARGRGRGLIKALSARACGIVTDHYPAFFLPAITRRAAEQSACRLEAVDSHTLIPLGAHGRIFTSARSYRAFMQRELRDHLGGFPEERPLQRLTRSLRLERLPARIAARWPAADGSTLARPAEALSRLPLDHSIRPVAARGGSTAGTKVLQRFLADALLRYAANRNDPDAECTSRLSPYLHFGHTSVFEVFSAVMAQEKWTTRRLATRGGGARDGWWGVSDGANAFLDQLVVWRELAFNGCEYVADFTRFSSVPEWARETLRAHRSDKRRPYDLATLEAAATHDGVWNATQRQLMAEGWFQGYLRMLWGKKMLEWAPDPQTALDWMESLMNRYSLDGRDPISYASFTWVMGRYDRPWPRRPVFGTVRYMSSESARRKLKMKQFLAAYGDKPAPPRTA